MIEGIITLVLMLAFIGLCLWIYRPGAKKKYQDAAKLPFDKASNDNEHSKGESDE